MSQVLGKPQLQDGDNDDEEEEDELVGLADYGDGPDSSDADPDSGTEEGGERPGVSTRSAGPGARTADLERIQGERAGGGVGRGLEVPPPAAEWGSRVLEAACGGLGSVGKEEAPRAGERTLPCLPHPRPAPRAPHPAPGERRGPRSAVGSPR
jgi:hypothetical protein